MYDFTPSHCLFSHYRLVNGAEYLFSARDDSEVSSWVSAINTAISHAPSQITPTIRQTRSINPLSYAPTSGQLHT